MIHWHTPDNVNPYPQGWLLGSLPCGSIILVHGVGEHGARYKQVEGNLANAGYAFFGFDLRGYQQPEEKRRHKASSNLFSSDLQPQMGNRISRTAS
jgi:alpha-beta hydrolase superfamily lysophospholipase